MIRARDTSLTFCLYKALKCHRRLNKIMPISHDNDCNCTGTNHKI